MKIRLILTILAILSGGVWLLSHFEGSKAAGSGTTVTQELEVVGQIGGEMTAVDHPPSSINDSWITSYPLDYQQHLMDFLASDGSAFLLEGGWLMKVDENGEVVWRNSYTNIANGTLTAIAETADGFVLGVSNYIGWFMIKVDETGQVLWAKKYGTADFFGVGSIIQTDDLGYLVAGSGAYSCSISLCSTDYWLTKLDANGSVEWEHRYDDAYEDPSVKSFLQMDDGTFLILFKEGVTRLASDGSVIWSKSYNIESGLPGAEAPSFTEVHIDNDGGLLLAGTLTRIAGIPGPFYGTCLLMKINVGGDVAWIRGYEAEEYNNINLKMTAQVTADGGYVATCSTYLYDIFDNGINYDFGLLKLDEAGFIVWQQVIGGDGTEIPVAVVETADNEFLIGGRSNTFNGDVDVALWRVRPEDDLCRCPFFNEGSFSTVDNLVITSDVSSIAPLSFTFSESSVLIVAQPETAVSSLICSTEIQEESTAVIPTSGGTVSSSDGQVNLVFPSGSFSEMVQVTYRHFWDDVNAGELAGMGERVAVTAVYSTTQQPAQLLPGATVTATVHYTDNSPAIEETLVWYQWQETGWQRVDSSQLSLPDKTITAVVGELGQLAVLGETHRVYLPDIPQNSNRDGYRLLLHLDESGNNFADRSGYGHDGQCDGNSCPTVVTGVNQMARHFDGVNDVIQLDDPQMLNLKGAVTMAAWVKPETAVGLQNIIAHGHALNPKAELFLRLNNGRYEVGSWDGSDHKTSFAMPTSDMGQWVHLVGVYDGTAWRLYRNGVEVSSTIDETGAVSVHGRWAVGASGEGDGRFFQGSVDEVKIYNRRLLPTAVMALYQNDQSQ